MKELIYFLISIGIFMLIFTSCKNIAPNHLKSRNSTSQDTSTKYLNSESITESDTFGYQIVSDLLAELSKNNSDKVNYLFSDSTENRYSCNFPLRKSFSEKIDQVVLKALINMQCDANREKYQVNYNFIETYGLKKNSYLEIGVNNLDKYLSDSHSILVCFSKPAISKVNNYALIYLSTYTSNLNADGSLYILTKENAKWKILAKNLIHYN